MKKHILSLLLLGSLSIYTFAQNIFINENFNTGVLPVGWTNVAVSDTIPFSFGLDGSQAPGNAGAQNIDGTKFVYFDDDLLGTASNGTLHNNNTAALTISAFDNSGTAPTYLEFDYNFRTPNFPLNDSFYVDVYDGTNWHNVFSVTSDDCGQYGRGACASGYPHALIDISVYKSTATKVRFTYFDGNDWGFYVGFDNVEVWSPYPTDLGATAILGLKSGCGLSSKDTLSVKIKNFGYQAVSSYNVNYTINGGTAVTETINTSLAPGDSTIYEFTATANLSTIGSYDIMAYTSFAADSAAINDTAKVQIINEPSYTPTYNEDFETSAGNWKISGRNPSWARGIPTAAVISTAPSGKNIFTTNLSGDYNSMELSYLTSPCFDFSGSNANPFMTFSLNYQLETTYDYAWMDYSLDNGLTWRKLMAGGINPSNWYNNTTSNVWTGFSTGWLNVETELTGLAGEPQVKFRMVMSSDGGTFYNGIGFDNFSIRERQPIDLSLNKVDYPVTGGSPLCGYGNAENIIVELQNKGVNKIDTMYLYYQVDNGPIYTDSLRLTLNPNSIIHYKLKDKYNFSAIKNYNLNVWVEAPRDGFKFNDSIFNIRVTNSQNIAVRTIPYFETFDGFQTGDPTQYNWAANTSGNNYKWLVKTGCSPRSPTWPTGTCADHTTGSGNYVVVNTWNETGTTANLETPCFDLSKNSGVILSFWYYRYGTASQMNPLYVDVYDGKSWTQEAAISNMPQKTQNDDWVNVELNLNKYAGRRIKIRFRAIDAGGTYGDIAIDDIQLYEPVAVDAKSLGVVEPTGGCNVSDSSIIVMEIINKGSKDILPDSMTVGYQVDNGPKIVETFRQLISSDLTARHTFKTTADLSLPGKKYNIKSWVDLNGDKVSVNDTNFKYKVTNFTKITNYFEDFESARTPSCEDIIGQVLENGWITEMSPYGWMVQNSVSCKNGKTATTPGTGPSGDHTTGQGNFLYTGSTTILTGKNIAYFVSPCLNLTQNTHPSLSFWYHMYGSQMGDLKVELMNTSGIWVNLLTISGQKQTAGDDAWKIATIDLDTYVGIFTQIRFVGTNGGARGNMAIDDIHLYERINQDVGVVDIISPATDNSCTLPANATVKAKVENFGLQTIAANSIVISYTNNNLQLAKDTINTAIPVGGSLIYTFPQIVDLSGNGEQNILVWTQLVDDSISVNNSLKKMVINRKVGFPYYFQDFESFEMGNNPGSDILQGWTRSPNGSGHTWHVWQGKAPLIDGDPMPPPIVPNGPSGDHTFANPTQNGNGMYMLTDTYFRRGGWPDALFGTPCGGIDFSNSKSGRILFSFWYHMFGNTGDLFIDVYDGSQWVRGVSVIRGSQQTKATEPWREWQVSLDNFANVTNGKIRFRAEFLGKVGGGDIGLDDISLLDQDTIDMAIKEFKKPISDCNLSNQAKVVMSVQNTGFTDIYQINMGYQITFFPINGDPIVFPVKRDSVIATVIPTAYYKKFEFLNRVDMSQPGRYHFKVWCEIPGDNYGFNDTLVTNINNTTKPFPYCEDFSTLLYDNIPKDFDGEILPNNWKGNPGGYAFKASIDGGNPYGVKGHTSGINDVFLLLDPGDGMPAQEAWIQTSCFDLTSTRAANLEFYYMSPNPQSELLVQVRTVGGGVWQTLDTLYSKAFPEWTLQSFVLADYVGNFVEFRLTGIHAGALYAIDDFCLVVPPPQQLELERFVTPPQGNCYYSPEEKVTLRIQNIGIDRIDSFRVVFKMDSTTEKYPAGQMYNDTSWIFPSNPTFEPGDKIDLVLDSTYFMEAKTFYYLKAYIYLPGDIDTAGNIVEDYEIEHPVPVQIPYIIDFEDPTPDELNGLLYGQSGMDYTGSVESGMDRFNETGPADDHTFQNGTGHYFVTHSKKGRSGDFVVLQTICVDLSKTLEPELQYWYHMFGYNMGQLIVEANDDYGWKTIDSLKGDDPDQTNNNRPWKIRAVKLNNPQAGWNYAGKYIRIRFVSYRGGDFSDMGLDDIFIFDRASKDLAPHKLVRPNSNIYSCYTDTQSVIVAVRNNGSEKIDFTTDSTDVTVIVKKNGVNWDTLHAHVTENSFRDATNMVQFLPVDSLSYVKMDSTFDMSDIGAMFDFVIYTDMSTEVLRRNDTINSAVLAQQKAGQIISIEPTDTVCYGSPVRLTIDNFFGALKWQEKQLDANNNGFWLDGLSFPNDSPAYVTILDTTSEIRVQVCRVVETTPVKVDITKPYSGGAVNVSRCGPGPITTSIQFPYFGAGDYSNIDSVFIYSSIDSNEYETIEQGVPTLKNGMLNYDIVYAQLGSTDTVWVGTKMDSCWSFLKTPVVASINPIPDVVLADSSYIEVCQDTTVILNAGGVEGHQYTYNWTIVNPDGTILHPTTQTLAVDAWKLELNKTYKYTVVVHSDSGCVTDKSNDTLYVTIIDSCVTGLDEAHFEDAFNIYPNPTNNELYVEYRSFNDLVGTIKLLTMEGKLLEEYKNVNFRMETTKFDMGKYAKGIYFIKIETNHGVIVRKIIRS